MRRSEMHNFLERENTYKRTACKPDYHNVKEPY